MNENNVNFEYVPNNKYKKEYENSSKKEGLDVLCEDFLFKRHRTNKSSINYVCKHKNCSASITISSSGKVIYYNGEHKIISRDQAANEEDVHLPNNNRGSIWSSILTQTPKHIKKADNFADYFTKTFFEGSYPQQMWNHFDTVGPRTNNNLEGFNSKLKKYIGAHPNIFSAIKSFQQQEVVASHKYYRAIEGKKPGRRNKKDIGKDWYLSTLKKMLLANDITLQVYIKYASQLFDINLKKKKKKKEEDSDDSEEEESEHDENNEDSVDNESDIDESDSDDDKSVDSDDSSN